MELNCICDNGTVILVPSSDGRHRLVQLLVVVQVQYKSKANLSEILTRDTTTMNETHTLVVEHNLLDTILLKEIAKTLNKPVL